MMFWSAYSRMMMAKMIGERYSIPSSNLVMFNA